MGSALSLLTRGLGKGVNFLKSTAFTGFQNPIKTPIGKAMTALTVAGSLSNIKPGSAKQATSQIFSTNSKYFNDVGFKAL